MRSESWWQRTRNQEHTLAKETSPNQSMNEGDRSYVKGAAGRSVIAIKMAWDFLAPMSDPENGGNGRVGIASVIKSPSWLTNPIKSMREGKAM